ncbi:MAG TPA: nuclear transport factor 2 family protein [Mucilaginibacter sp.]|nr:nuclear transport factor 2 family protein [Mucilaginibacter sp.]
MKSIKLTSLSFCLLAVTTLSAHGAVRRPLKIDSASVNKDIAWVDSIYAKAFAQQDTSLFLKCYAADGAIMPPGRPLLSGKPMLLAFFNFGCKSGVRNIVFSKKSLYGLTDQYVTEQGQFEMFDDQQKSIAKGKFLTVWKKTPQGWKMFRDMFSGDAAAALGEKK